MSRRVSQPVEAVRAAYDLGPSDSEWLRQVTRAMRPMIDPLNMGCIGYQIGAQPPSFDFGAEVGCEGILEKIMQIDPGEPATESVVRMLLEPSPALLASEVWAGRAHEAAYRRIAHLDVPGIDLLMLRIRHIDGNGITVITSPQLITWHLERH